MYGSERCAIRRGEAEVRAVVGYLYGPAYRPLKWRQQ